MNTIICKAYSPPESLVFDEMPAPRPAPGEVVVSVRAAALNFPDLLIIENKYQIKPPLPFAPGGELAGRIKEVGPGVSGFQPGDRVIALTGYGAFAEEIAVDAARVVPTPNGMDDVTAAGLLYAYGTADHALTD